MGICEFDESSEGSHYRSSGFGEWPIGGDAY